MKKALLTILRNHQTSRDDFRLATDKLSLLLAGEAGNHLNKESVTVQTPLAETSGELITKNLVIIPILRAGLAMLPSFLRFFPHASVGFFGMRRDEETKKPHLYYENLPKLTPDQNIMIIDPMIATGGSGVLALKKLLEYPVTKENIIYVGIIGAPEGIQNLQSTIPEMQLLVAETDERLNQDAFIVPGIGDFGDRFFGTE